MRKNKKVLAFILAMVNVYGLKNSNAAPSGTQVTSIEVKNRSKFDRLQTGVIEHKRSILETLITCLFGYKIYKQRGKVKELESKLGDLNLKQIPKFENGEKVVNNSSIKSFLIKTIHEYSKYCDQEFIDFVSNHESFEVFNGLDVEYSKDKYLVFNPNYDPKKPHKDIEGKTYEEYRNGVAGFYAHGKKSFDAFSKILPREFKNIETGWKIHVSPDFFHCTDILRIVEDLRKERNFNYKFVKSPYTYRMYFNVNQDQAGKFVTIYPKDDQESRWIVEELNKRFVEKGFDESCFLEVKGDFKVYPGIYVRMSEYGGHLDDNSGRGTFCIPIRVLGSHCDDNLNVGWDAKDEDIKNNEQVKKYEHPFEHLYAHGVEMPKKVCEINGKLGELNTK